MNIKNFFKSELFSHITTFMAMFGHLATYIQAYKIFSLRSAYAISLLATFISLSSIAVWLIYGLARNIKPLIYANIFGFIGTSLITAGALYYSK